MSNMNSASVQNFPTFSNRKIREMTDHELQETINKFMSYIRQERKHGRDTRDAEIECAYLLQERDERNNS
jgi:hypothetical protein